MATEEEIKNLANSLKSSGVASSMLDAVDKAKEILKHSETTLNNLNNYEKEQTAKFEENNTQTPKTPIDQEIEVEKEMEVNEEIIDNTDKEIDELNKEIASDDKIIAQEESKINQLDQEISKIENSIGIDDSVLNSDKPISELLNEQSPIDSEAVQNVAEHEVANPIQEQTSEIKVPANTEPIIEESSLEAPTIDETPSTKVEETAISNTQEAEDPTEQLKEKQNIESSPSQETTIEQTSEIKVPANTEPIIEESSLEAPTIDETPSTKMEETAQITEPLDSPSMSNTAPIQEDSFSSYSNNTIGITSNESSETSQEEIQNNEVNNSQEQSVSDEKEKINEEEEKKPSNMDDLIPQN